MRQLRSSLALQLVGGFLLGTAGIVAMHPSGETRAAVDRVMPAHVAHR